MIKPRKPAKFTWSHEAPLALAAAGGPMTRNATHRVSDLARWSTFPRLRPHTAMRTTALSSDGAPRTARLAYPAGGASITTGPQACRIGGAQ